MRSPWRQPSLAIRGPREPCRRRFGFGDDDLTRLTGWVAEAGIRWAIDGTQRAAFALDRLRGRGRDAGSGYGDLKKALFEHYWNYFADARKKRAELVANLEPDVVHLDIDEAPRGLAQQAGGPERPRLAGLQKNVATMVREIISRQQEATGGGLQFPGADLLKLPE